MNSSQKVELSVEDKNLDSVPHSENKRNILLAAVSALLYIVVLGMVSTYSSPACVDMLKPGSRFIDITADQIAWIASLPPLTGFIGNALSGYLSLKFGRRAVMMFVSTSFTFSWLIIAYAENIYVVYAGRLMSGFSAGFCSVAVSAYVVEISTVEVRGLLSAGFQVAFSAGVFLVIALGAVLRWSWLAVSGAVVVVCGAVLMCFMPESPPWLVREGKNSEAIRGLLFLKGRHCDAMKELNEIIQHHKAEPKGGLTARELLQPTLYKPMLIAIFLMFFQQFSGINALMSYSVELFQSSEDFLNPSLAAIVVAAVQLIAAVFSSVLMDKVGRRILYITSGACMAASLGVNGAFTMLTQRHDFKELHMWNWVPLVCFMLYIAAYALGFGPIPTVVTPEMVPTHSRSFLLAVATVSCSLFGFVVTKIFDNMRNLLGLAGVYWFYAAFSLLGFLFYWIFIPETKGKTICDINSSFSAERNKT